MLFHYGIFPKDRQKVPIPVPNLQGTNTELHRNLNGKPTEKILLLGCMLRLLRVFNLFSLQS